MIEFEKANEELLEELMNMIPPPRKPDEIDAYQLVDKTNGNMSLKSAHYFLDKLVQKGILKKRTIYDPDRNHSIVVYRKD